MQYGYVLQLGSKCSKCYPTQKALFEAMSKHVGDAEGQLNIAGMQLRVLRCIMK